MSDRARVKTYWKPGGLLVEFLKDMLRIPSPVIANHMLQYYIEENEQRHESLMENIIRDDKTKSEGRLVDPITFHLWQYIHLVCDIQWDYRVFVRPLGGTLMILSACSVTPAQPSASLALTPQFWCRLVPPGGRQERQNCSPGQQRLNSWAESLQQLRRDR